MRILALETSGRHGSVAALSVREETANLEHEILLDSQRRTAQTLAPTLHELLSQVGWTAKSIELVAVTVGPGSFTGLRIGVTSAKTFAYATSAALIGVNTLAVLAAQAPPATEPLWTVLDAQRGELFSARFLPDANGTIPIDCSTSIVSQEVWLSQLQPGDHVTGLPLRTLKTRLPPSIHALSEQWWQPMAGAVGRLGWQSYQAGQRDDVWKLLPQYYRLSAAEEKLR